MRDALRHEFDVVLAESLDRFSRDQEDTAGLFKRLTFVGVRIVTLADGDITHLHSGFKGTMNALFLKDLAEKTHRGLRGRIEAGKSGGGLCYGDRVAEKGSDPAPATARAEVAGGRANGKGHLVFPGGPRGCGGPRNALRLRRPQAASLRVVAGTERFKSPRTGRKPPGIPERPSWLRGGPGNALRLRRPLASSLRVVAGRKWFKSPYREKAARHTRAAFVVAGGGFEPPTFGL